MFILHSSNKTENLVAHLCAVFENAPLSTPFVKEIFLIQSQGMERWLSQQLAVRFGVFGNFEFLFPEKFFSALAQKIDLSLSDDAFDRHVMLWRIEALLRRLDGDEFLPLRHYLAGDNTALKRFQLARQLTQLFDQYQIMRPDMLAEWQVDRSFYHSEAELWQKQLWLQIIGSTGNKHRGALWQEVIAKLNAAEEGAFCGMLPERVSVFGMNTMPPLFLSYLQGLAKHCQLHFYLLNPAQTFWADLAGKRQRIIDEYQGGHPLLSALGQQGREFQEMLLDQAQFDFEPESFELNQARNTLQQMQNDILNNEVDARVLAKDDSISIHACHTRLREVEVLRDQLLWTLERDESLELRDIIVMAPDIEAYEPFISAVFKDIQHAVADRSLRLNNQALDIFICFLNLSQSRFGWHSVLDLLDRPIVYSGFGLSETDLDLIKYWLQETRVRWGKSAEHKKELDLPELDANTWQAALDRMLMGYAVNSDAEFVDGILPYPEIEGSSAQALGGLCEFMALLFQASQEFKEAKTLKAWSDQLFYYADRLLRAAESVELQELNDVLSTINEKMAKNHHDPIEMNVIVAWLEGMIAERKSSSGFLRGQLTFCSMLPMRSIPFRVIALLGMNEGEFPKIDRHPTFDLLAQNFRKGDRSRRSDDRYQFLEILLSVRERLIITYIGQSINHNENIPPSVAVSELMDVLEQYYGIKDLVVRQPLHSFSPRYYEGGELFSFSEAGLETACALSARDKGTANTHVHWWQGKLELQEPAEIIELSDFFRFFQHPQRFFLRRRLDLYFNGIESMAEEREPFTIDPFDRYAIYHEWIHERLAGRDPSLQKMQAQGRWIPGVLGELEFHRKQLEINQFIERIKGKNSGKSVGDILIDLKAGDYRLVGKLGNLYESSSLIYRYADLKGKDFLGALLHHLIINHIHPETTHLLGTDQDIEISPEICREEWLIDWLDIYRLGQVQPDAFFVEPAFTYVKEAHKQNTGSRITKSPLEAAWDQFARALEQPYEPELRQLYGNLTDPKMIMGETFERQCQKLLLPVWEAAQN